MTPHVRKNVPILAVVLMVVMAMLITTVQGATAQENQMTEESQVVEASQVTEDSQTTEEGPCPYGSRPSSDGAECVPMKYDANHEADHVGGSATPGVADVLSYPTGEYKVKVIWARPSGVALPKDLVKNLTTQVTNMQNYLRKEVGRTLRIQPGIATATIPNTKSAGDVSRSLINQGYNDSKTYYIVLADIGGPEDYCGLGGGQFAVLFVKACGLYPNDVDTRLTLVANVMLHELFHGLGAVSTCAPNSDGSGHMKGGQNDIMTPEVNGADPRIDAGRDDYFATGARGDSCWDISRVNVWIPKAQCQAGPWCPPTGPTPVPTPDRPKPTPTPTKPKPPATPTPPKPAGRANQSSVEAGGAAARAFDGNTDGKFGNRSVSSTRSQKNAWWQVALPETQTLGQIVVWNRTDCCSERLSDFWVLVSDKPFKTNDLEKLRKDPAVKAKRVRRAPNPKVTVGFNGVKAKYVRVQLHDQGILSLAEVQVIPKGGSAPNASTAKARQSSTQGGAGAARAIDGNTEGNYGAKSVTQTRAEKNAWWQMDLSSSQAIKQVVVWNRTDCCGDRLSDFWVLVSDKPFTSNDLSKLLDDPAVTARQVKTRPNPSATVNFGGVKGKYVRVQLAGSGTLSLAEVQVK